MPKLPRLVTILSLAAIISGAALPVYAESAPVYDADSLSQPFDSTDSAQDNLPPPPPPGAENNTFVPVQPQATSSAATSRALVQSAENAAAPAMNLDQRVKHLEEQMSNTQGPESSSRMESLQNQVQSLRGQVEQLTHQIELIQTQQKTLTADIDKRLAQQPAKGAASAGAVDTDVLKADHKTLGKATPKSAAVPAPGVTDQANQPNVAEEQQIYQTAYNLIKAKKYNDAVTALQGMLQKYPSGQFASNAHYWLGELYGLMNKNDQALTEFSTVVKTYPDSPRVSDAQLKVGLIYASQLKWPDAKNALKRVINHYPGTASARLASEQLKQIKQAGH